MLKPLIMLISLCWITLTQADSALIASASNFQFAMRDLTTAFESQYPHQISQTYAASGVLYNQVKQGAPYHAILSANEIYPELLAQQGLGLNPTRFTYALGQLVLASTKKLPANDPEQLTHYLTELVSAGGRIAIANTDTAPYGIAAQQTLASLKLWPLPKQQIIRGNNVGQTFQFVMTGNTDVGFVALSQRLQDKNSTLSYELIPQHWYQPIQQQAILLQSGQNNPAAIAFLAFLKTDQAKTIIQRHGYTIPD
ncbi:molybdate ABC transporter substrate-binding protein [Oceanicoccus sp. KOV_DT_Chl]|uniref:molybdate ABC transporter substrate-binding protein n=1 Tax=Oceanicoccus sp. KOV_DT_Chl TaxID=1904639 RepID=UPI000C799CE9|nr:molybdate ABC transporter substrate-binding protein [Oceanicoccus sp. KOV_DT_Chl]